MLGHLIPIVLYEHLIYLGILLGMTALLIIIVASLEMNCTLTALNINVCGISIGGVHLQCTISYIYQKIKCDQSTKQGNARDSLQSSLFIMLTRNHHYMQPFSSTVVYAQLLLVCVYTKLEYPD